MKPRHQKQAEAQDRNARWAKLTPQEQLSSLDARGFAATKQRARIGLALLAGATEPKASNAGNAKQSKKKSRKKSKRQAGEKK